MSKIFSVMTYNIHSSIGMDGKASPSRIAEVIARYNPAVVALQELDAGLVRTEMVDQAHVIAASLEMSYLFHPSIRVEEGEYGNAVFSRYPIRLVRSGALPTHPLIYNLEGRGALWVEIEMAAKRVQVIATHLGLNRQERMLQARALNGPEWLRHSCCRPPIVLCGDFNTLPGSPVYRTLVRDLLDAQRMVKGSRPQKTWPVRLPFLRIDHVFVSPDIRIRNALAPRTPLTSMASDHLPLVVTMELS